MEQTRLPKCSRMSEANNICCNPTCKASTVFLCPDRDCFCNEQHSKCVSLVSIDTLLGKLRRKGSCNDHINQIINGFVHLIESTIKKLTIERINLEGARSKVGLEKQENILFKLLTGEDPSSVNPGLVASVVKTLQQRPDPKTVDRKKIQMILADTARKLESIEQLTGSLSSLLGQSVVEINVVGGGNKQMVYYLYPSDTILDIKSKIMIQENVSYKDQELLSSGVVLQDKRTISSYSINETTKIVLNILEMEDFKVQCKSLSGRNYVVNVWTTETVKSVKQKLSGLMKVAVANIGLVFKGKTLDNNKTVEESHVAQGDCLTIIQSC